MTDSLDAQLLALQGSGSGLGGRQFRWPSQTEPGRAFLIWQLMPDHRERQ